MTKQSDFVPRNVIVIKFFGFYITLTGTFTRLLMAAGDQLS